MNFSELFFDLLINLPALIALIVGMAVTLATWRFHPPAARWAFLAFGWLFVTDLIAIFWRTVGIDLVFANRPGGDLEEILSFVVLSSFEALAYFFFMIALMTARIPYRSRHSYYEDDRDDADGLPFRER